MQSPTSVTVSPTADRPQPVVNNIREAADTIGVSFDYLLAQATQESGLDPEARNTRSSASGLFQFTQPTWLDMIRKHGAAHGLDQEAAAITLDADGQPQVKDKAMKKAILDLRKDPKLSSLMAAEYAKDNAQVLEKKLGRPATASDLYLAHFLGAGGAARVIKGAASDPKHSAHALLPEAARANPDIFHEHGSQKARTVASLYKNVQARLGTALGSHAAVNQPGLTGRVDLAMLRPEPRPEMEAAVQFVDTTPDDRSGALPPPGLALPDTQAGQFASAIEPESPFFPTALPPAPRRS
jgi:hypothetical protein